MWAELGYLWIKLGSLWIELGCLWAKLGSLWVELGTLWVELRCMWAELWSLWAELTLLGEEGCFLGPWHFLGLGAHWLGSEGVVGWGDRKSPSRQDSGRLGGRRGEWIICIVLLILTEREPTTASQSTATWEPPGELGRLRDGLAWKLLATLTRLRESSPKLRERVGGELRELRTWEELLWFCIFVLVFFRVCLSPEELFRFIDGNLRLGEDRRWRGRGLGSECWSRGEPRPER